MNSDEIEKFIHDGWVIMDVPQPEVIHEEVSMLGKKVRELTNTDCRLDELHNNLDDEEFRNLYTSLSEFFWENEFSIRVSKAFLPILKDLIGLDVMVQYMPFLRLARPHHSQDNIGYHRDTQYGQTPYELAVHIPFVDLDEASSLKVISGSHQMPESAFPNIEGLETNVTKGSTDHMLGKPYSPKQLALPESAKTESLTMHVGQAAFFSPALFHGQEENLGNVTRVTTDVRFVNPNVKVKLRTGKTRAGYVHVAHSPVQQTASDYYQAQQDDARKKTA